MKIIYVMKIIAVLGFLLITACAAPSETSPFPSDRTVMTGESCGGMMGIVCGNPQDFCKMSGAQQCGTADQMGTCSPRPNICTQDYRPVCGCDGKTYGNECMANGAGISAAYKGECRA